ncbi:pyrroloquinoline quinone biosynthesis protein PqqC [Pseudomonas mandelii JR-1]|uniref:Pyrroloquinoline quinone biosynthesis protein PqqC n=1 Tax=Pseudomonas mandelii JR-1 TaxID=1147786 RepID=A0A024EKV2_9PSED|nr:pyrroloquinoline quinone biosynthesis protein PqqC [Pseudomonas mandelii JR-1]
MLRLTPSRASLAPTRFRRLQKWRTTQNLQERGSPAKRP